MLSAERSDEYRLGEKRSGYAVRDRTTLQNKSLLGIIRQVKAMSQVSQRRRRGFIRQVAPGDDSVAVPQFEAAERRRAVLETDLVDEHLRRRDDPRKVPGSHVAHLAYPSARTFLALVKVEDPVLRTRVADLAVRVTCAVSHNTPSGLCLEAKTLASARSRGQTYRSDFGLAVEGRGRGH